MTSALAKKSWFISINWSITNSYEYLWANYFRFWLARVLIQRKIKLLLWGTHSRLGEIMPEMSSLNDGLENILVFQASMKVLFAGMTKIQTTITTIGVLYQMENTGKIHWSSIVVAQTALRQIPLSFQQTSPSFFSNPIVISANRSKECMRTPNGSSGTQKIGLSREMKRVDPFHMEKSAGI